MSATLESTTVFSETQYAVAPKPALTIRIIRTPDPTNDKMYFADGEGYFLSAWRQAAERAVKIIQICNDAKSLSLTPSQVNEVKRAWYWLRRSGLTVADLQDNARLDRLMSETLYLLSLPADSPAAFTRCEKCGSKIWGDESIKTGIGSECRRKAGAR